MQLDDDILINEMGAYRTTEALSDPITRNLVCFGIAEARMRAVEQVGRSMAERSVSLPARPFDMQFFTDVLVSMFTKREILEAVLEGKDLAQASGWDV